MAEHKYICRKEDLDLLLDDELKIQFQGLFNGISDKKEFLSKFGIDFDHPTVRDAVSVDIVKLEDDKVSNDSVYSFDQYRNMSKSEWEKVLLHRNFRINLVNLEPEYRDVVYAYGEVKSRQGVRVEDRVYQGVVLSEAYLKFFSRILDLDDVEEGWMDVTTESNGFMDFEDIQFQVALIPNTKPSFHSIVSKEYYEMKSMNYAKTCDRFGIDAISSFALVDPNKDKNHTGQFLVKIMRKDGLNGMYKYVCAVISHDGKIVNWDNGVPQIYTYQSDRNLILCVCEKDFWRNSTPSTGVWTTTEGDIEVVKSTTSSHYSVFRQYIPDHELEYVRQYIQFKTRLEGMELYLKYIDKDIEAKKNGIRECYNQQVFALRNLLNEFGFVKEKLELRLKYYSLLRNRDEIYYRIVKLNRLLSQKEDELGNLIDEYKGLNNGQMDAKLNLGEQIRSLRLEIDKSLDGSIHSLIEQKDKIEGQMDSTRSEFNDIDKKYELNLDEFINSFVNTFQDVISTNMDEMSSRSNLIHDYFVDSSMGELASSSSSLLDDEQLDLDLSRLNELNRIAERWGEYMYNLGYELNQLLKIRVKCDDETIKVRRLVHNFATRIARVEEQTFDDKHMFKKDFNIRKVDSAGIRDIILLLDWHACNAADKTYKEMGFASEEKFVEFRKRCDKMSLDLRKGEYAQILAKRKINLQELINKLTDQMAESDQLKWNDKYGRQKGNDEKEWSIDDVTMKQYERVRKIVADNYGSDQVEHALESASIELRSVGLVDNTICELFDSNAKPVDINFELNLVDEARNEFVVANEKVDGLRFKLTPVIDEIEGLESEVRTLDELNDKIIRGCKKAENQLDKTSLIEMKLENKVRRTKLKSKIARLRKKNKKQFDELKVACEIADMKQLAYDNAIKHFKNDIGFNETTLIQYLNSIKY